jgi:hypothetical protein
VYIAEDAADTADALQLRAAGHQRMIDISRRPNQEGGSHILAWADRPEARTEAALYGTVSQVTEKLHGLREAGVTYVLANILGQSRATLRRLATDVAPALAG